MYRHSDLYVFELILYIHIKPVMINTF